MEVHKSRGDGRSAPRKPFQYSLRSMLIVMTAVAVGLSVLAVFPFRLIMLVAELLALAAPMVLTIVLIYGRGNVRTFCIGALFPAGVLAITAALWFLPFLFRPSALSGGPDLGERLIFVFFSVIAGMVIVGFGLLAVWVRRVVEARTRQHQEGATPHGESPVGVQEGPASRENTSG